MTDLNTLLRLAQQMNVSDSDLKNADAMAEKFRDKDEEEILEEILRLKESFTKDRAAFKKQLNMLKNMRPMLGREQRMRFDRLIEMLEQW